MSIKKLIGDSMGRLYKNKYITLRDGNVSFKPKNENFFLISAGSVRKNEINVDQILRVYFDKHGIYYDKSNKYQPSREIHMHSLLQTHKDYYNKDTFVIHAHPPNIIAYIGIDKSRELNTIKDIFPEINVGNIGNNVGYFEAGSIDLAKNCFDKLLHNDIVGMERHGSLSIGNDIEKLFEDIETLEYYINIYLKHK